MFGQTLKAGWLFVALALSAILFSGSAPATPLVQTGEALAIYRGSVVTQDDFQAFLETIPSDDRAEFLSSPERVERTLTNMVLGRRALDLARESGELTAQPLAGRIGLEAGRLAVDHLRRLFLDEHMLDDYTEVARELFLSRPSEFVVPATVDFAHIVVAPVIDGDPVGGMRMILELYDNALATDDLREIAIAVGESGDHYRAGGDHQNIRLDQLERALAQRLSQMQLGQISEPLRTSSGWHIVQLHRRDGSDAADFDEVRDQAIDVARARHREDLIVRFRNELLEGGVELPDGAIREMLARNGVSWTREGD